MATGIQEQSDIVLTPQEAEAVLELWARKQAEGELRSRLNVQDLAEAMSLPISEVERMVISVRATHRQVPVETAVKRSKPVNGFLIAVAVFIWIAILGGVASLAYRQGRNNFRIENANALAPRPFLETGFPTPALAPESAVAMSSESLTTSLPLGSTAQFNGFVVEGSYPGVAYDESGLVNGLKRFVRESSPSILVPVLDANEKKMGIEALLDPAGPKNSIVEFLSLAIKASDGRTFEAKVPVVRRSYPELERAAELVRSDQIRRLANQLIHANKVNQP